METEYKSVSYSLYYIAIAILLWTAYGVVYRLYLHPLAHFPGPKLAISTYWYEFYYDVIKRGRYTWKLKELHEQYGPIIRINPNELHINDPGYYDEYSPGAIRRIEKPKAFADCFGPTTMGFATVSHELHRIRRSALNPYFSKRSIAEYAPVIQSVVDKFCTRLDEATRTGELVNLKYAYAAVSTDVINEYCYSRTYNAVLAPDFNIGFYESIMALSQLCHVFKQMPWFFALMHSLPGWFVKSYAAEIDKIRSEKSTMHLTSGHQTVFHALLNSDLPPAEKTSTRLGEEARGLVGAGTFTVAHTLRVITYHVLANPSIHQKLVAELETVAPSRSNPAPLAKLEKLPYFSAVILEGLRLAYGVSHRLGRASPDVALTFHGQTIPAGTTVTMSSVLIHDNPDIYPQPSVFNPDRWLADESQKRLQRYLVPFGKGTRMCAGLNLAYAEIYLALGSVFRRFDFEMVDVVRERDIDITHDFFNTSSSLESKGMNVRVLVRK
ncbi:hypothetical protein MMC22_010940 [Lobaria immixta]|nr:hypothetical protein [Lobaria immixta]